MIQHTNLLVASNKLAPKNWDKTKTNKIKKNMCILYGYEHTLKTSRDLLKSFFSLVLRFETEATKTRWNNKKKTGDEEVY